MSQPDERRARAREQRARSVHHRYVEIMLDRIRTELYPSPIMLDVLEQVTHGTERAELIDILLEKIERDRFPSVQMLERVARLAG